MGAIRDAERGQGTVEWVGLVLAVALVALALATGLAGWLGPVGIVRSIAGHLLCAADLVPSCSAEGALVDAYGTELAARVADGAPEIDYEEGMTELPVDFRSCRSAECANGAAEGSVGASYAGEPAAAFVHVVDCGSAQARRASEARGYTCTGGRAGNVYVQYWLYYPDSSTAPWSDLPGRPGSHADDWEGYQLRIGPAGIDARASSHHGYSYRGGPTSWPSDAGLIERSAWGGTTGRLYVSGGSHAGHVYEPRALSLLRGVRTTARAVDELADEVASPGRVPRRVTPVSFTRRRPPARWTPPADLRLIPTETLEAGALATRFAITPPWRKPVYRDPEDRGT